MTFDRDTAWARHLVNFNQTPEQRKAKYALARSYRATVNQAARMRDWRESKIKRCFGVS